MENPVAKIREFVAFVRQHLTGDEKGEAQVFCDRLFQAFGHAGIFEAGGALEYRVHKGKTTRFADLLWRPRLLMEMKKRGEKLERHYRQAFDYWLYLVPNRPQYVVLCNFDEFWVYDFNTQLEEPLDRVRLDDLPKRSRPSISSSPPPSRRSSTTTWSPSPARPPTRWPSCSST